MMQLARMIWSGGCSVVVVQPWVDGCSTMTRAWGSRPPHLAGILLPLRVQFEGWWASMAEMMQLVRSGFCGTGI